MLLVIFKILKDKVIHGGLTVKNVINWREEREDITVKTVKETEKNLSIYYG